MLLKMKDIWADKSNKAWNPDETLEMAISLETSKDGIPSGNNIAIEANEDGIQNEAVAIGITVLIVQVTKADTAEKVVVTKGDTAKKVIATKAGTARKVVATKADMVEKVIATKADMVEKVVVSVADTVAEVADTVVNTVAEVADADEANTLKDFKRKNFA